MPSGHRIEGSVLGIPSFWDSLQVWQGLVTVSCSHQGRSIRIVDEWEGRGGQGGCGCHPREGVTPPPVTLVEISGNSSHCPRAAETECSVCNTLHYHPYPRNHHCEALINSYQREHPQLIRGDLHPRKVIRSWWPPRGLPEKVPDYLLWSQSSLVSELSLAVFFSNSIVSSWLLWKLFPSVGCLALHSFNCSFPLPGSHPSLYLALLLPSTWLSSVGRKARCRSAGQGASEAHCWKMVGFVGLWHLTAPSVHLAAEPACPLTTEGRTAMPANY